MVMNAEAPTVDPLPSRGVFKFHFPYRPSNLLCSALIFWTVLCMIAEAILPLLAVIFTLTIYGPTIYLAAQYIRQSPRATDEPTDGNPMGKKAVILACLWILIIPTHVYVKWIEPKFSEIFLLPVLPGSQAIVLMLYIAVRCTMEKRITRLPNLAIAPIEASEEAPPSAQDPESQPLLGSNSRLNIYRPSKVILIVSVLVALGAWATETLCLTWGSQHRSFAVVLWFLLIWLYVPLIQLQLYTLKRAFRGYVPTLTDEGGIGNYSIDLAAMFVGMKPLIVLYTVASTQYSALLYVPGFIQLCLVVYTALRYAWSFSDIIPKHVQFIRRDESPSDAVQAPVPEQPQPEPNNNNTSGSSTTSAT